MSDPISGNANNIQSTSIDQTQATKAADDAKAASDVAYAQAQQHQQAQKVGASQASLQDLIEQLQEILQQAQGTDGKPESSQPQGAKGTAGKAAHKLHSHHGLMSLFGGHHDPKHPGGPTSMPGLEQALTKIMGMLQGMGPPAGAVPPGFPPPPFPGASLQEQVMHMTPDQIKTVLDKQPDMPKELRNYLEAQLKYDGDPAVQAFHQAQQEFQDKWPDGPPTDSMAKMAEFNKDKAHLDKLQGDCPPPPRPEDFGVKPPPQPGGMAAAAGNVPPGFPPPPFPGATLQEQVNHMTPDQIKTVLNRQPDMPKELRNYLEAQLKYDGNPAVQHFHQAQHKFQQKWPDGPPTNSMAKMAEFDKDKAHLDKLRDDCPPPPRPEDFGVKPPPPPGGMAAAIAAHPPAVSPDAEPDVTTTDADAVTQTQTADQSPDFSSMTLGEVLDERNMAKMSLDDIRALLEYNQVSANPQRKAYVEAWQTYKQDPDVQKYESDMAAIQEKWPDMQPLGDSDANEFNKALATLQLDETHLPRTPTPDQYGISY